MDSLKEFVNHISAIEASIGYTFNDKSLLTLAFTHCSFVNENKYLVEFHNERLEFLGDSILGLIISEYLYKTLPSTPEGDLSYFRSRLVEASSCSIYMKKLSLSQYILLGKGERLSDGSRGRDTILADLFEAIVGAIYLDGGIEFTKHFVFKFSPEIEEILKMPLRNWKAQLQDAMQKKHQKAPEYRVIDEAGPDHSKLFKVSVLMNNHEIGQGEGPSKKEAQQAAAQNALMRMQIK